MTGSKKSKPSSTRQYTHSSSNSRWSEDEDAFKTDHIRRCADRLKEIQRRRPNPYEPSGESEDQRIIREHYEKEDIDGILNELSRYTNYDDSR